MATMDEKMSRSHKNKPIKHYSLVTFLVFLFVIVIYKFREEKWGRTTCENLNKLKTLSDIASNVEGCDILEIIYSINSYATPIIIPGELQLKVEGWLKEDEDLLKSATNQNVIHITNKVNPLQSRSKTNFHYVRYLVKQLITIHLGQKGLAQRY